MVLTFWIDASGNVATGDEGPQLIENTTKDTALRDCLVRETGRVRFVPPPSQRTQVRRYVLGLSPQ